MRTSGRVSVGKVVEADLEVFFEHQLDPDANEMAAFPARDKEAHMAHWAKILRDDTMIARTVVFDEEVAGNVVSWEQDGKRMVGATGSESTCGVKGSPRRPWPSFFMS